MEITWLGHSCFSIKGKEATLVTDPFDETLGYPLRNPTADIVTISHNHPHHSFVAAVEGQPKVISGPGEYEIAEVFIYGIRTWHDAEGGKIQGQNTVYLIEIDELRICHLGDLGHVPTAEQAEEISGSDVLLIPVGGGQTIDASTATEIVSLLQPKLVIPMHFKTEAVQIELDPVDRFLKELGAKGIAPEPKLAVTKSSLPEETKVVLLDYRG